MHLSSLYMFWHEMCAPHEDGVRRTLAGQVICVVVVSVEALAHGLEVPFPQEESHECGGEKVVGTQGEEQQGAEYISAGEMHVRCTCEI